MGAADPRLGAAELALEALGAEDRELVRVGVVFVRADEVRAPAARLAVGYPIALGADEIGPSHHG